MTKLRHTWVSGMLQMVMTSVKASGAENNSSRYQPPRFCLSDIPTCRYPDVHTHKDIVNPQLV
jgi:hypothetical protein